MTEESFGEQSRAGHGVVTEHLSRRVSSVERSIDGLREQNAHAQNQLSSLRTESQGHTAALHDIKAALDRQQASSKTDWQVVVGFFSTGLLLAGLALAPVYRDLFKIEHTLQARGDVITQQAEINGRLQAEIEALRQRHDDHEERLGK